MDATHGNDFVKKETPSQHPSWVDSSQISNDQMRIKEEPDDAPVSIDQNGPSSLDSLPSIRRVADEEDLTKLEALSGIAIKMAHQILGELSKVKDNGDIEKHADSMKRLLAGVELPPAIIGVAGDTGAGKSSIINAILGEENIVPTNCMQACTAVVTEISFNDSNDPAAAYRAEIEFITKEEWIDELGCLYGDLSDENASGEFGTRSESNIALAKLKAVYPDIKSQATLIGTTPAVLAERETIRDMLGTTKKIAHSSARAFQEEVQGYVDSKKKKKKAKPCEDPAEVVEEPGACWPLIKRVRLYVKADVLSTGARIVDLPGYSDANAARAAIAAKYIEKCSALWIVAPIKRAVDNSTAKDLLGDSFRLQLKLDGTYSDVTFICSMTDDISVQEAAPRLGLDIELDELTTKDKDFRSWDESTTNELERSTQRLSTLAFITRELESRVDEWAELEAQQRRGGVVFAPSRPASKRSSGPRSHRLRKRRRTNVHSSENATPVDDKSYDDLLGDIEQKDQEESGLPLTKEQIKSQLERFEKKLSELRQERRALEVRVEELGYERERREDEADDLNHDLLRACISKRNEYSRKEIRIQFAEGLKELDELAAMQEAPESYDATTKKVDYEAAAQSLAVFCVSSRAFQKLCGRLQIEKDVPGYGNVAETEIPDLITHVHKLTLPKRIRKSKEFLNDMVRNLISLHIWASDHSLYSKLSDNEKQVELANLSTALRDLNRSLDTAVVACARECRSALDGNLYKQLSICVQKATAAAPTTAHSWACKEKGDGGMVWQSYKAACRRSGVYANKTGSWDMNEDLARPLKQNLVGTWTETFQTKVPDALHGLMSTSNELLGKFHTNLAERFENRITFVALDIVRKQMKSRSQGFYNKVSGIRDEILQRSREANREFTPIIKDGMQIAYSTCLQQSGPGVFKRMQAIVEAHLAENSNTMFLGSVKPVKKSLEGLCDYIDNELRSEIASMLDSMMAEYATVITGKEGNEECEAAKDVVTKLILKTDGLLCDVLTSRTR